MIYIITEEQYDRAVNQRSLFWLKRRFDSVKEALKETFDLMEFDICRIDDYETFEKRFFSVFMDCLHPYFYDDDNFSFSEYDGVYDLLKDVFYVECTEFYFGGREKC